MYSVHMGMWALDHTASNEGELFYVDYKINHILSIVSQILKNIPYVVQPCPISEHRLLLRYLCK